MTETSCDVLILGAGTGGTAAALALQGWGLRVILTEPTDWVGGQLTSQLVPPDEHPWIETCGRTLRYAEYRERVRQWYRDHGDLTPAAARDKRLNPGSGWVSWICHRPDVGEKVLRTMLAPALAEGLDLRMETVPVAAQTVNDRVTAVTLRHIPSGQETLVTPRFVIDATELGDGLALTGTEYALGAESRDETGEPHALSGDHETDNVQGFTWCAVVGWDPEGDHTIERPREYDFWRAYQPTHWPDKLLSFTMHNAVKNEAVHFPLFSEGWFNLFSYRQIVDPRAHNGPTEAATCVNWPMNDFFEGSVIDVPEDVAEQRYESARQLTLSLIYWLQTEHGYKGLRLRPDLAGTKDGLAKAAYIRESRRLVSRTPIREQDIAAYTNPGQSLGIRYPDSVGIGGYRLDLHPSANGVGPIDTSTLPFQIPMGSLIPVRVRNLLAACKNIGVTHLSNGSYRLHPVEWNIGEAAGLLAAYCLTQGLDPVGVHEDPARVQDFQKLLFREGIDIAWPEWRAL